MLVLLFGLRLEGRGSSRERWITPDFGKAGRQERTLLVPDPFAQRPNPALISYAKARAAPVPQSARI